MGKASAPRMPKLVMNEKEEGSRVREASMPPPFTFRRKSAPLSMKPCQLSPKSTPSASAQSKSTRKSRQILKSSFRTCLTS